MQPILNEALLFGAGTLALTMVLSFFLGPERHFHLKDTGVKTHVLVGMGLRLFTLTSIYGFVIPETSALTLDPSRFTAQIVSGIGFLGAGVTLVNNDTIKDLTTAATVWLSAVVGVVCGTELGVPAVVTLVLHFLLVFVIGPSMEEILSSHRNDRMVIEYKSTRGVMREILVVASEHGHVASVKPTEPIQTENGAGTRIVLRLKGPYPQNVLMKEPAQIKNIMIADRAGRAELD